MDEIADWAFLVAGVGVGSLLAVIVFRARASAVLEAALAQVRLPLQAELAAAQQRARTAEAEVLRLREQDGQLRLESDGWRKALELAQREAALQADRAARMPQLESEVSRLHFRLRLDEEEMRRLSSTQARKDELVTSLVKQVQQVEAGAAGLQARLDTALRALHDGARRRDELEREAARAQLLERQLGDALRRGSRVHVPQATATPAERPADRRTIEPQLHHLGRQVSELRLLVERGLAAQAERIERLDARAGARARRRRAPAAARIDMRQARAAHRRPGSPASRE